ARDDVPVTASVGIAANKCRAKLASDLCKPNGVAEIDEASLDAVLLPLAIERLPGVGSVTGERLRALGLATVRDVRARPKEELTRRLGPFGEHLFDLARGHDERPVVADRESKSMGEGQTIPDELEEPDDGRPVL